MKKLNIRILLLPFLLALPFITYGQYQLPNPGFESWVSAEKGEEPVGFHSFNSASASGIYSIAKTADQLSKEMDTRPGSSGSYSARINSRSTFGTNANGNLTTGQIVAGSATPSSTDNHNRSYPSNAGYNQPFTGKPDAMTVWVKYEPGNAGDYARVNTVIHGNANYQDPEDKDYTSIKYAQATLNYQAAAGNGWQQLNIPFNVVNSGVTPAYILISFSTNKDAGKGTSNDVVYIDDIEFIYNSRLASLKVGGSNLSGFDKNTYEYTYQVNSLSSLPAITATADGIGATVEQKISGGTATITVKGNDYSSNPANIHTYIINFVANTEISASDITTTYGTAKALSVTTNNDQSALEYAVADPSIARVENGQIVPLKAGSTTLTISQKASKNYTAGSKTVKLTVNKATLTVTANNATRPFGSQNPTFTLTYKGFVNGESEDYLTQQPTATCKATATSPVGAYDITVSGGASDNYTFIYIKGSLSITTVSAQISITPIGKKTYGDPAFTLQAISTNSESPITYSVADPSIARISNGQVTLLKAGSTTITARQAASTNYGESSATTQLVVDKAALTVTALDATRPFGTENPAFGLSYKGFVNGDNEDDLTRKPTASCTATTTSPVGSYDITVSGGVSDNYTFTYVKGTLSVTTSSAQITIPAIGEKSYGDPAFDLRASSPNTESPISYTVDDPTIARVDNGVVTILKAGSTTITARQAASANFEETSATVQLTVKKAPLTVTVAPATRTYGSENPSLVLSYSGFVLNETDNVLTEKPTLSCDATTTSPAGTYDIIVSGGEDENYDIICQNGTLTVEKALLTVTADDATRSYGEENPVFTFSYSGFVLDETEEVLTVKPTVSCEATTTSTTGNYDIVVSGGEDENYRFAYVKGTLTITASSGKLTITPIGEKRYGDEPFALQVSTPNTESPIVYTIDDKSIARIDDGQVTLLKAGSTTITASQEASTNFGEASASVELVVKKAPLTLRAENKSRTYGAENPAFTLAYEGLVYDDTAADLASPTVTCEATATSVPAGYPIVVEPISDDRYEITPVNGELTVEKALLQVSCRNESSVVGQEPTTDYEMYIEGFVNGEDKSVIDQMPTITCEVTAASPIGFYPLVIGGGEDDCYTFAYTEGVYTVRSATMIQTEITLAPIAGKRYGDQPFAPVYATNNTDTEVQLIMGTPGIVEYENGQLHILKGGTTTLKAYQKSGLNFTEGESTEITLTVEKAPLRVSADDAVRIEGEENPKFTLTFSGFVNGDDASCIDLLPTATCEADTHSAGGYYDITVSGGEDDCYTFDQYVSGTLLVKGKTLLTLSDITDKRYGDEPFTPSVMTNNTESAIDLTIADTTIARLDKGKIVIVKSGTTTLTARQDESAHFSEGEAVLTFTIGKAPLRVSADNAVRIEGEENPEFTFTISGFINGDDASCIDLLPSATCEADTLSAGGYYDIVVSGGEDDCYTFDQYVSGTLLVKGKTHLTLAAITDKRYGDVPFTPDIETNNTESLVHLEIADPEIADIVNGKIVIYKSGETTLKAYQNESALFSAGESEVALVIEKAPLSVSVDNTVRQVGEPNPEFTLTYSGFVNGDDASCIDTPPVAQCLDASISSPAGYYNITVSGGEDDCYTFAQYVSGTLVVTAVSGVNAPTLDGASIYLANKRLVVKGISADIVEIFALNGRLAGRYRAGDIVDLPAGFYIAKAANVKACLQVSE